MNSLSERKWVAEEELTLRTTVLSKKKLHSTRLSGEINREKVCFLSDRALTGREGEIKKLLLSLQEKSEDSTVFSK